MRTHPCRQAYDAFLVVHGTDTMAYTASALSLMLQGFRKPIVMTGGYGLCVRCGWLQLVVP